MVTMHLTWQLVSQQTHQQRAYNKMQASCCAMLHAVSIFLQRRDLTLLFAADLALSSSGAQPVI
jgi:hypothetical protein